MIREIRKKWHNDIITALEVKHHEAAAALDGSQQEFLSALKNHQHEFIAALETLEKSSAVRSQEETAGSDRLYERFTDVYNRLGDQLSRELFWGRLRASCDKNYGYIYEKMIAMPRPVHALDTLDLIKNNAAARKCDKLVLYGETQEAVDVARLCGIPYAAVCRIDAGGVKRMTG